MPDTVPPPDGTEIAWAETALSAFGRLSVGTGSAGESGCAAVGAEELRCAVVAGAARAELATESALEGRFGPAADSAWVGGGGGAYVPTVAADSEAAFVDAVAHARDG